jgi:hypothetical protein
VRQFWLRGALLILLVLPTNLIVLQAARHGIQTRDASLYLSRDEADALAWIESSTPSDALILAAPETGLFIPAHTGRRVSYGHPFETVQAESQRSKVEHFFQGMPLPNTDVRLDMVDYIFYGPREREIGRNPLFDSLPTAYQNPSVVIYTTK